MITIVTGLPGSGKTLFAMACMEEAARKRRQVYTNIELLPNCPIYDWPFLIGTESYPIAEPKNEPYKYFWEYVDKGSLVVLDEADVDFWCQRRDGDKKEQLFLFNKFNRKFGLDLVYLVQRLGNLDLSIRSMCQRFVVCEHNWRSDPIIRWFPRTWSRFLRSEFGHWQMRAGDHIGDGYWSYAEGAKYFNWYKTDQIVGASKFCNAKPISQPSVVSSAA